METRRDRLAAIRARKDELRVQKSSTDRELSQIDGEEKDLEKYELEDIEKEAAAIRARLGLPVPTVTTQDAASTTAAPKKGKRAWLRSHLLPSKVVK